MYISSFFLSFAFFFVVRRLYLRHYSFSLFCFVFEQGAPCILSKKKKECNLFSLSLSFSSSSSSSTVWTEGERERERARNGVIELCEHTSLIQSRIRNQQATFSLFKQQRERHCGKSNVFRCKKNPMRENSQVKNFVFVNTLKEESRDKGRERER